VAAEAVEVAAAEEDEVRGRGTWAAAVAEQPELKAFGCCPGRRAAR